MAELVHDAGAVDAWLTHLHAWRFTLRPNAVPISRWERDSAAGTSDAFTVLTWDSWRPRDKMRKCCPDVRGETVDSRRKEVGLCLRRFRREQHIRRETNETRRLRARRFIHLSAMEGRDFWEAVPSSTSRKPIIWREKLRAAGLSPVYDKLFIFPRVVQITGRYRAAVRQTGGRRLL